MAWFKMDDGFAFHPKTLAAGNAAAGAFARMGTWSSDQLTEGHIPTVQARLIASPRELKTLAEVGYLHKPGDRCHCLTERPEGALVVPADWSGYWLHDFLEYNPTRAKVLAERARATERQRRARDASKQRQLDKEASHVTA